MDQKLCSRAAATTEERLGGDQYIGDDTFAANGNGNEGAGLNPPPILFAIIIRYETERKLKIHKFTVI